jgi:RsiW-degrading membrane proteinase PrsW (M82 family)
MEYWEDKHNNFCSYWRATMFRLVFASAAAVFILLMLFVIGDVIYQNPLKALIIVGSTVGLFSAVFGIFLFSMYLDERKSKRNYEDIPDSLFVAKYKSYKSKVCPMVEYDK